MFRELIGDFKPELLRHDDVQAALAGLNVTYPARRSAPHASSTAQQKVDQQNSVAADPVQAD